MPPSLLRIVVNNPALYIISRDFLVGVVGLEPTRDFSQRIFLLLHVTMAAFLRCSLDYVFSISRDLGGWYIGLYTFIITENAMNLARR